MRNFTRRDFIRLLAIAAGGALLPTSLAHAQETDGLCTAFFSVTCRRNCRHVLRELHSKQTFCRKPHSSNGQQRKSNWMSVDYTLGGQPHGYILLDTTVNGLISRYSEYPGTKNLYDTAVSSHKTALQSINNSPAIVKMSRLISGHSTSRRIHLTAGTVASLLCHHHQHPGKT